MKKFFFVLTVLIMGMFSSTSAQSNQWFVLSANVDSANITVTDTGSNSVNGYRLSMDETDTTGTRYAQFKRGFASTAIPQNGFVIDAYVPLWVNIPTRIAISFLRGGSLIQRNGELYSTKNGASLPFDTVIANSMLDTIYPGNGFSAYSFHFPQVAGNFDSLVVSLSYLEGMGGTRVVFMDNLRLLYGTDTVLVDAGGDIDSIAPEPPTLTAWAVDATHINVKIIGSADADLANVYLKMSKDVNFVTDSLVRTINVHANDTVIISFVNLNPNTTYFFKGKPFDGVGNGGGYSLLAWATTPQLPPQDITPPGKPEVKIAGTGIHTLAIMCVAPSDTDVTHGFVLIDDNVNFPSSDTVTFTISANETLNVSRNNLSSNTLWYTKGVVIDRSGNTSPFSLVDTAMTWQEPVIDSIPPAKPIISARGISPHSVELTVIAPNDGSIKTVRIKSSYDVNLTDSTIRIMNITSAETLRVIYDTLPSNTNLYFKARLIDSSGNYSPYSLIAVGTTFNPPPQDTIPPVPPQNFSATGTGVHEVTVRFQNPPDASLDSLIVELATDPNFLNIQRKLGTNRLPNAWNTLVFQDIPGSSTLCFARGMNVDSAGNRSQYTAIATTRTLADIDTIAPTPPTAVVTPGINNLVFLMTNSQDTDLDSVGITIATNPNFAPQTIHYGIHTDPGDTNTLLFSNLASHTTYYWKRYARDTAGNVAFSATSMITTLRDSIPPPPPLNIAAIGTGVNAIRVVFQNPMGYLLDTAEFYCSQDPNFLQNVFVRRKLNPTAGAWDTLSFTGLVPNTLYYVYGIEIGPAGHSVGSLIDTAKTFFTTGITDKDVPRTITLKQNYPNPFNPTTTISYTLTNPSHITLKVYDAAGREVTELVNEFKPAGEYEITFDASNLASGNYFCRLATDSFIETKKMVLMK